jgi:hypothetical protein
MGRSARGTAERNLPTLLCGALLGLLLILSSRPASSAESDQEDAKLLKRFLQSWRSRETVVARFGCGYSARATLNSSTSRRTTNSRCVTVSGSGPM